jgi:hypothetical protein
MSWDSYEARRDLLLKQMKKQTDHLLKEEKFELWQKQNAPKKSYTHKPKVYSRNSRSKYV